MHALRSASRVLARAPIVFAAFAFGTLSLHATQYRITSAAGFSSLPTPLQPGDEILIEDGTYANVGRTLTAAGTAAAPVVMRARNPGSVFFSGATQFAIKGSWLQISGLVFDGTVAAGAPKYSSGVFRFQPDSSDCTLRDCRFNAFDAGGGASGSAAEYIIVNGYRHTIEYCSFAHKGVPNPVITLLPQEDDNDTSGTFPTRDVRRLHRIRYCYFGERTDISDNGYETIRIGDSGYQMYAMAVTIEHCLFERAIYGPDITSYEPEVISNKSRGNLYRFNTFLDCKGGLVLRHGDDCVVDSNFFFGEPGSVMAAGVRIIGLRHTVSNNYFQDIGGTGLRSPISLMKGSGAFPDNSTNNTYESPNDARILHNTIVDCATPFDLGSLTSTSGNTAPTGVRIENNLVQSSAAGGDVIVFNDSNGWTIDKITFAGNRAYHPAGAYGSTLPASGFVTGTPLQLALDPGLGYFVPATTSPAIDAAVATAPAIVADLRGLVRPATAADAGAFELESTGTVLNRPLTRTDVGPAFDGRASADRAPFLIAPPVDLSGYVGDAVTFSPAITSDLAVSYQWFHDGRPLAGATFASLALASLATADAGVYTLTAVNTAGNLVTYPVTLTVAAKAPSITTQPKSQLVNPGATVTFTVAHDGLGPFVYQWFHDNQPVPDSDSATLTLSDVQSSAAGAYHVTITGDYGSVTSDDATLSFPDGTLLLADTFGDGDRTTQALPTSAAWYSSSTSGSGNLAISSGALLVPAGRHALAYFTAADPLNVAVGHRLSVSFNINFSAAGTEPGGLRLGLFDSHGARVTTDGNSGFDFFDGYILTATARYPDKNNATAGPMNFRQRIPKSGNAALISSTTSIYTSLAASSDISQSFVPGTDYTFTFTVSRPDADTVHLAFAATGGTLEGYTFECDATTSLVTAFDAFAILSTSSNGSTYTIDNVSVESAALPVLTPLETWRQAHFGTTNATGDAADTADPDHDGVYNLIEYALGLDPLVPDAASGLPFVSTASVSGDTYATLAFARDTAATGVTFTVQASSDLVDWTDIDPFGPNQLSSDTTARLQTLVVRDIVPLSSASRRFLRLRLTAP